MVDGAQHRARSGALKWGRLDKIYADRRICERGALIRGSLPTRKESMVEKPSSGATGAHTQWARALRRRSKGGSIHRARLGRDEEMDRWCALGPLVSHDLRRSLCRGRPGGGRSPSVTMRDCTSFGVAVRKG